MNRPVGLLVAALLPALPALAAPAPPPAPRDGPLTPAQALAAFRVEPGLRVELVAAEPLVGDPVALAFDERGALFVAENRGYPTGPGPNRPPAGVIARLRDADGDGRYETRTVFADQLTFPNGLAPWRGGLIVTCAPDVLFLKDTDGDGRADERRVLLTGFDDKNTTQLRVSHPLFGLDGWCYLTSGYTGASKVSSPLQPARGAIEVRTDSRFRPDTGEFEPLDGRAQFGQCFDDFGRRFICYNRVHLQHVVLASRYLRRNPHLAFADTVQNVPETLLPEPLRGHGSAAPLFPLSANVTTADSHAGTFTAACAVHLHRGTALPSDYRGAAFACDPTGNLVHADRLASAGATFTARALLEGREALASADDWFRPVFLADGPDGALYVADMYRRTIEHPQYLPEEIRKRTDFDSGRGLGRIWRLTGERAASGPRRARVDLARASVQELCALLHHPNGWHRDTAHRLLLERRDAAAVPLLKARIAGRDPNHAAGRVRALHLLDAFGALDDATLLRALHDPAPGARENALALAEPRLAASPELAAATLKLAADPDARVRFQGALALGELRDDRVLPALADIVRRDAGDRWARAAALSAVGGRERAFLRALLAQPAASGGPADEGFAALLSDLGRLLAASERADQLGDVVREIAAPRRAEDWRWQIPALAGLVEGARSRGGVAVPGLLAGSGNSSGQGLTPELFSRARVVAGEATAGLTLRQAAITLLGAAGFDAAGEFLLGLLAPQQPAAAQSAAVRALAQMSGGAAAPALVARERWAGYSQAVRETVLGALLSQPRHVGAVLDALEAGVIPPGAIDANRRKQLAQHRDAPVRARAEKLFAALVPGDRMKAYEECKAALALPADARAGRDVFKRLCAQCHRLDREGVAVGPDLFGIRNQPKEAILLHLVVPEYEILPGFAAYEIETRDGRTLSGLIAGETATSVTLRGGQGMEETILRGNIARLTASALSLMPQELEQQMTRQELADLLAFLKGEAERR